MEESDQLTSNRRSYLKAIGCSTIGGSVVSADIVGAGNMSDSPLVYTGSTTGSVYAINAITGESVWEYETSDNVSYLIGSNDELYMASGNSVYAVSADSGQDLWTFEYSGDLYINGITVIDDSAYFTVGPSAPGAGVVTVQDLLAIDADSGEKIWRRRTRNMATTDRVTRFGTIIVLNGDMYAIDNHHRLYVVDPEDGTVKQRIGGPSNPDIEFDQSTPVIESDTLYSWSADGSVIAYDLESDEVLWESDEIGSGSPPIIHNRSECVFWNSDDSSLYGIDSKSGDELWQSDSITESGGINTSYNGDMFISSRDGELFCFDIDEREMRWSIETNASIGTYPVIVDDVLYIGNDFGQLRAYDATSGELIWTYRAGEVASLHTPTVVSESYNWSSIDSHTVLGFEGHNEYFGDDIELDIDPIKEEIEDELLEPLIYIGTAEGNMYSYDLEGNRVWEHTDQNWVIRNAPVIVDDVVYYAIDETNRYDVYTVNAITGDSIGATSSMTSHSLNELSVINDRVYTSVDVRGQLVDFNNDILEWERFLVDDGIVSRPEVDDSLIYFCSDKGGLIAIDKNFENQDIYEEDYDSSDIKWVYEDISGSNPPILHDGELLAYDSDKIVSVDASSGALNWEYSENDISSDIVCGYDSAYINSYRHIISVNTESGEERWTRSLRYIDGAIRPGTLHDGFLYLTSNDGDVIAIDAFDGEIVWEHKFNHDKNLTTPTIYDGILLVGSRDGNLHSIDAKTGETLWTESTSEPIIGAPSVNDPDTRNSADSAVLLGTTGRHHDHTRPGYMKILNNTSNDTLTRGTTNNIDIELENIGSNDVHGSLELAIVDGDEHKELSTKEITLEANSSKIVTEDIRIPESVEESDITLKINPSIGFSETATLEVVEPEDTSEDASHIGLFGAGASVASAGYLAYRFRKIDET